jgi:hypothetical protein
MQMVKQEPNSNQCGLCTVAMLTDRTREEMLAKFPDYKSKADYEWLNYMRHDLGITLEDPRNDKEFDRSLTCDGRVFNGHFKLPQGFRYYCTVVVPKLRSHAVAADGRSAAVGTSDEVAHAVAIDERGMVFDPSTGAPMTGTCTLEQYVRQNQEKFGEVRIGCCYRVIVG